MYNHELKSQNAPTLSNKCSQRRTAQYFPLKCRTDMRSSIKWKYCTSTLYVSERAWLLSTTGGRGQRRNNVTAKRDAAEKGDKHSWVSEGLTCCETTGCDVTHRGEI